MAPEPIDLTTTAQDASSAPSSTWTYLPSYHPILGEPACTFPPDIFLRVVLNMLKNPNITSSHLFRADILYDSRPEDADSEATTTTMTMTTTGELQLADALPAEAPDGFTLARTLVRRLVPRNPQLDKPLLQTCHVLEREGEGDGRSRREVLVQCIPHVVSAEEVPWYHPAVKGLLYAYSWMRDGDGVATTTNGQQQGQGAEVGSGRLSVHYRLFSEDDLPLEKRLQRTAFHLLSAMYKHGHGQLQGYTKKFHHDLLVPQARVQDTYSSLKLRHAKRLCDAWVESTEPSKHVFEDLAIAAFLVELWRDMYRDPTGVDKALPGPPEGNAKLPEFPGFVDIGCGNGVLTEVLLCCGYSGGGFDARKRKTWAILGIETQKRLEERILVPQPLLSTQLATLPESSVATSTTDSMTPLAAYFKTALSSVFGSRASPSPDLNDQSRWHNGLFPRGTFIVSNHADELTAWTPLLASLSASPFLAIPCCSHNLAGTRFRAPSAYTNFTADAAAPNYFAKEKQNIGKTKHIAIQIPMTDENDENEAYSDVTKKSEPETGDLRQLSPANRAKQPSAYSSLCDWVATLADEVGFDVEKDMLRIPSTRNIGIIARRWQDGLSLASRTDKENRRISEDAWDQVMRILDREKPDSQAWVERARKLMSGKDDCRVNHE